MSNDQNLYELLGLTRTATDAEIKRAYKLFAQKFHPDKNLEDHQWATGMMKKVNDAWRVLSDPQLKLEYDTNLVGQDRLRQAEQANFARETENRRQQEEARQTAATARRREEARRKAEEEERLQRQDINKASRHRSPASNQSGGTPHAPTATAVGGQSKSAYWMLAFLGLLMYVLIQVVPISDKDKSIVITPQQQIQFAPQPTAYPRCAGNPEMDKCIEFERQIASESQTDRRDRQRKLEEERRDNMTKANELGGASQNGLPSSARASSKVDNAAKESDVALYEKEARRVKVEHPELNRERPGYRIDLIVFLNERIEVHIREGYPPHKALQIAVRDLQTREQTREISAEVAAQQSQQKVLVPPVLESPMLDKGGHSGFDPKCRWVTPSEWSCK